MMCFKYCPVQGLKYHNEPNQTSRTARKGFMRNKPWEKYPKPK